MQGGHSSGRIGKVARLHERLRRCPSGSSVVLPMWPRVRVLRREALRVSHAPTEPAGRLFRGPAAYEPRTPWHAGAALAATIAIVGLSFLGAWLLPTYLGLDEGATAVPNPVHPEIRPSGLWVVAIFQVSAIALTLLASAAFGGWPRNVLALGQAPAGWRTYAGAILAMAGLQAVLAAVPHLFIEHDMLADLRPFVGLVAGPNWPLAVAVLGIGAPLSEELLFRGFLLGALAQSPLGFWGAALVTTAFWTALHAGYTPVGLAEVFAIGLFLSWLLWRTGSLRVTIFCHGLYNLLIVLALRLAGLPGQG
jgi:CAAX protease family protein